MAAIEINSSGGDRIHLPDANVSSLRSQLTGDLLAAGDRDYDEARTVWNAMVDQRPALIARCTSTSDVVAAVNLPV